MGKRRTVNPDRTRDRNVPDPETEAIDRSLIARIALPQVSVALLNTDMNSRFRNG